MREVTGDDIVRLTDAIIALKQQLFELGISMRKIDELTMAINRSTHFK